MGLYSGSRWERSAVCEPQALGWCDTGRDAIHPWDRRRLMPQPLNMVFLGSGADWSDHGLHPVNDHRLW